MCIRDSLNGRHSLLDTTKPPSLSAWLNTGNKEHGHGREHGRGREHEHRRCRGSRHSSAVHCSELAGASLQLRAPATLKVLGTTCGFVAAFMIPELGWHLTHVRLLSSSTCRYFSEHVFPTFNLDTCCWCGECGDVVL